MLATTAYNFKYAMAALLRLIKKFSVILE